MHGGAGSSHSRKKASANNRQNHAGKNKQYKKNNHRGPGGGDTYTKASRQLTNAEEKLVNYVLAKGVRVMLPRAPPPRNNTGMMAICFEVNILSRIRHSFNAPIARST